MNDEIIHNGRVYKIKRKLGETPVDDREKRGINARDNRIAKQLYESYRNESDHVYL